MRLAPVQSGLPAFSQIELRAMSRLLSFNILAALIGWSFASTVAVIAQRWSDTPEYSHGWLVPVFALWLIWHSYRRPGQSLFEGTTIAGSVGLAVGLYLISLVPTAPDSAATLSVIGVILAGCGAATCVSGWLPIVDNKSSWLGWCLVVGGLALRMFGAFYYIDWFEQLALIPVLAGIALVVLGWTAGAAAVRAIAFLVFMVPLPFSLETALRDPLRKVATVASTYVLQVMGLPTVSEGYVILVGEARIGVTEACSGLSMLMVFAALTVGVVLSTKRALWYQAVLCLSWPAIAVLANVFRIVVTAGLHAAGYDHLADITFHDLAGAAMMPVGILLLWAEMSYLDRLVITETDRRVTSFLMGAGPTAQPSASH
jgi:exosortase